MRVAISGDRHWPGHRYQEIRRPLETLDPRTDFVILGDAEGVDSLALIACEDLKLPHHVEEAEWKVYGKGAGPIRNRKMLENGKPDVLWWFHPDIKRSKGTRNMVRQAEQKHIHTERKG